MPTRVHLLKTWPEPFAAVRAGTKTYEIRKDDRGFAVGDYLNLVEYEPGGAARRRSRVDDSWMHTRPSHTGEELWTRVVYMTPGGSWGLPADVCVLGIELCDEPDQPQ